MSVLHSAALLSTTIAFLVALAPGVVFAAPEPSMTPAKVRYSAYVHASVANVRKAPDADADIVERLRIGRNVRVEEERGEWRRVLWTAGSESGWVHESVLGTEGVQLDALLARARATSDAKEKRKWAERATAFAPLSEAALLELVSVTTGEAKERLGRRLAWRRVVVAALNKERGQELCETCPPLTADFDGDGARDHAVLVTQRDGVDKCWLAFHLATDEVRFTPAGYACEDRPLRVQRKQGVTGVFVDTALLIESEWEAETHFIPAPAPSR